MAKGRPDPSSLAEEGSFEMTSMIDVTFLLIIFFMCCTEISDASKSKIQLPRVHNGEEDINPTPGRLLINVLATDPDRGTNDGQIQIFKQDRSDAEVMEMIKSQVAMGKINKETGNSEKPVLIRADKRTKYKSVQKVMKMCLANKLFKISFTALAPDPGHPE